MLFSSVIICFQASATARHAPLPRASPMLTLRGGGMMDTAAVTQATAGLLVANGVFAYVSPAKNLELYGVKGATVDQVAYARYGAALQLSSAAVLLAGASKGAAFAATVSFTSSAVAVLMGQPGFEPLGGPKEPIAVWIVVLTLLGKMAHEGKYIDGDLAIKIALGIFGLCGAHFSFAPQSAIDMYKIKAPVTKLGKTLFKICGNQLLSAASYFYFANTQSAAVGLAAYLTTSAAFLAK